MTDRAAVSGRNFGFHDQRFVIDRERYFGVGSVGYGFDRKVKAVFGQPVRALGYVEGPVEVTPISMEMLRRSADVLVQALKTKDLANGGTGDPLAATCDIYLSLVAPGVTSVQDKMITCKLTKEDFQSSGGEEGNKVKVEFFCLELWQNGVLIGGEIE